MATGTKNMSDAILSVEHLSMKFGGLIAVNDLTFEARRGEISLGSEARASTACRAAVSRVIGAYVTEIESKRRESSSLGSRIGDGHHGNHPTR